MFGKTRFSPPRLRQAARQPSETPCRLVLEGREVVLTLRRSARRSLALQIDHRGPRVSVPYGLAQSEVERFVRSHTRWLLDKLDERSERPLPEPMSLRDGAEFPLLGEGVRLRIGPASPRQVRWRLGTDGREELWLPASAVLDRTLVKALRARALAWFGGRVEEFCFRLNQEVPAVRLTSANTRWGSCSRSSGIRLHWRLIHLPPALSDYVVAHEVAHLEEMNHSPRFWAVVESLYPDWRAARQALRKAAETLPLIGGEPDPTPQED
ncbi:DUF45 domain-containing protein [Azoarcus indigens]|uniref:M48 family metallopeptidase n=1 Tax=Azoarcus indigens TaxID=29545 RepID=UPI00105B45A2|nr:DUF45 domain-containing protein [Azoarcus indigens]